MASTSSSMNTSGGVKRSSETSPPQIRKRQKIGLSEGPAYSKFGKHLPAICQIVYDPENTKRMAGSGFLIGRDLLITNNHVLPNREIAKKSRAYFLYDSSNLSSTFEVFFDPQRYFYTCESPYKRNEDRKSLAKEKLDFTIIALKETPQLKVISFFAFSILKISTPCVGIIYCSGHPIRMSDETKPRGIRETARGTATRITQFAVHHFTPTAEGSSGSPILDPNGKLIAMQHGNCCTCKKDKGDDRWCKIGIRMDQIVSHLKEHTHESNEREYDRLKRYLESHPIPSLSYVPKSDPDFTGREKDLKDLHSRLCSERKRVAVIGLGGVGKSELALKYAENHEKDYQFIRYIRADKLELIIMELLKLAEKLGIPECKPEERLEKLKENLEEQRGGFLLIFDGLDHPHVFEKLNGYLPNNGSILMTSRLSEHARKYHFKTLELEPFPQEVAIRFLTNATQIKPTDGGRELVDELGCLPLALSHAAAYMRTRNFSFKKYLSDYKKYEVRLFEKEQLPSLSSEEKTVLTTWNMSLETIESYHQCFEARKILSFLSYLGRAPIHLLTLQFWVEISNMLNDDLDLGRGLALLGSYSMLRSPQTEIYTIHPLVQKVSHYQLQKNLRPSFLKEALEAFGGFVGCIDFRDTQMWTTIDTFLAPHCYTLADWYHNEYDSSYDTMGTFLLFFQSGSHLAVKSDLPDQALSYINQGLKIAEQLEKKKYYYVAVSHEMLAIIFRNQTKVNQAEKHGRLALKSIDKAIKQEYDDSFILAKLSIYRELGITFAIQTKMKEAGNCIQSAIDLQTKRFGTKKNRDVARTVLAMGAIMRINGALPLAEKFTRDAVNIQTTLPEVSDLERAGAVQQLASILKDQENYQESEDQYKDAVDKMVSAFGTREHHEIGRVLSGWGDLKYKSGRFDEAEALYKEALNILSKYKDLFHPMTLVDFSRLYIDREDFNKVSACFKEALSLLSDLDPSSSQNEIIENIANGYWNLGINLVKSKERRDGLKAFQHSFEIRAQIYGSKAHPKVIKEMIRAAKIFWKAAEHFEAEDICQTALEFSNLGETGSDEKREVLELFGKILRDHGRLCAAKEKYEAVLKIPRDQSETEQDPKMAEILSSLAEISFSLGKIVQAKDYADKCKKIKDECKLTIVGREKRLFDLINSKVAISDAINRMFSSTQRIPGLKERLSQQASSSGMHIGPDRGYQLQIESLEQEIEKGLKNKNFEGVIEKLYSLIDVHQEANSNSGKIKNCIARLIIILRVQGKNEEAEACCQEENLVALVASEEDGRRVVRDFLQLLTNGYKDLEGKESYDADYQRLRKEWDSFLRYALAKLS